MIHSAYTDEPMPDLLFPLQELPDWLRIAAGKDETTINRLVQAAMQEAESHAKQPLFERSYSVTLNGFKTGYLRGLKPRNVTVSYTNDTLTSQPLTLSNQPTLTDPYVMYPDGLLQFRAERVEPLGLCMVTVNWTAGAGVDQIPGNIVDALYAYIADRYDNRGNGVSERMTLFHRLINHYVLIDF